MGGLSSTGTLLTYNFTYDAFGRTTSVKVMNKTLASYTYQQNTGLMLSTTYGNGFTVAYSYDDLGRVTTVKYNSSTAYTYEYDGSDYLTYNHYDDLNRLSEQVMVYGYVGDDVNECK